MAVDLYVRVVGIVRVVVVRVICICRVWYVLRVVCRIVELHGL